MDKVAQALLLTRRKMSNPTTITAAMTPPSIGQLNGGGAGGGGSGAGGGAGVGGAGGGGAGGGAGGAGGATTVKLPLNPSTVTL